MAFYVNLSYNNKMYVQNDYKTILYYDQFNKRKEKAVSYSAMLYYEEEISITCITIVTRILCCVYSI